MRAVRLSEMPLWRDAGAALVEEYLRRPDAWNGVVPDVLPTAHQRVIDYYPGAAVPPGGDALLAEMNGQVVGQVLVVPHDSDAARLERMYVAERARRQRVGSLLMAEALTVARALGYRHVVLDVIAERDNARRLYERFGFVHTEPYADYGRAMVFLRRSLGADEPPA